MLLNKHRNKAKVFLPALLLFLVLYLLSRLIPAEEIERIIIEAGPLAPIVYIFISLLTYIIAPLSGTPVAFVGFHIFGSDVVIFHTISAFISFSINFGIARIWGRGLVEKIAGKESTGKIDNFINKKGYLSLFIIRVFLATYHDFISYAYGLTNIKYFPYIIISTIGLIPGYIIWYWIAQQSSSALTFTIHTFVVCGVFIGIYWVWTKYFKRR